MTIYNLGSINADHFYRLPNLPQPGETLFSTHYFRGLGGKGTNMSVAAARAAARVIHIGAVGKDGAWAVETLMEYGVDTRYIAQGSITGHANVFLDPSGENAIVLHAGANHELTENQIAEALSLSSTGDIFLLQNETNMQTEAAKLASSLGLYVVYAAAPFDAQSVKGVLPYVNCLIMNEIEAQQLTQALGQELGALGPELIVVTLGSKGSKTIEKATGKITHIDPIAVKAIDTTGAGDTYTGYFVAGLDRGFSVQHSARLATQAAALMVTKEGTADVIPDLKDIEDYFGPNA